MIFSITEFENQPNYSIAVAIVKESPIFNHCGIIFKENDNVYFLHLANHCELKLEEINVKHHKIKWLSFSYFSKNYDLNNIRKSQTINILKLIYRRNINSIPYATLFKETTFSIDNQIKLGQNEFGLTCATFVLAAFRRVGIPELVKYEEWIYRVEDDLWRDNIIKHCNLPNNYIDIIKNEKKCCRYRPEEVTAATSSEQLPASFNYCKKISDIIILSIKNSNN
jgi:hypothetical protein